MRVDPFSLPLAAPLATAAGTLDRREGFVVRCDRNGVAGIGEATPLPGWTESVGDCERALVGASEASDGGDAGPAPVGDRAAAAGQSLDGDPALSGLDANEVPAARHGVATSLFDAEARDEGVPLYRWFDDDRRRDRVPVNATVGDADPAKTVERGRAAVAEGFDCLKLKVGVRPLDADLERVRAVREAVGDGVALRLDANGAWDRETGARALERLATLDVAYVEQPLPADDLDGLAALRGGPVGVAVDESLVHARVGDVLDAGAADVLILKPMVLGGPGRAYAAATRAREAGVEPVVTTTVDGAVARAAAVHVAAALPDVAPCGLATADRLGTDIAPDPAPVDGGEVAVPQDPGVGVEPGEVTT
ncbi:MAG: mandelate racemase/muconate lactonizing enzyme family protein [Haloarculaceae archaeon]